MKNFNVFKVVSLTLFLAATFFFFQNAHAQVAGDNVSAYNTFEDATITGGQQTIFSAAGPVVVGDDVEFFAFSTQYDVDISNCGMTMTLVSNEIATDLVLPADRYDRNYFAFASSDVSNVSVTGGSPGLTTNVTVIPLPPGYVIPAADLFGFGIPLPITMPNGGFVVEFGEGSDFTELGQVV